MRSAALVLLLAACSGEAIPLVTAPPEVPPKAEPKPEPKPDPEQPFGVDGLALGTASNTQVLGFSPDGTHFAFIANGGDLTGDLHIVDVATGANVIVDHDVLMEFPPHREATNSHGVLYRRANGKTGWQALQSADLAISDWRGNVAKIGEEVQRNAYRFGGGGRYIARIEKTAHELRVLDRETSADVLVETGVRMIPHHPIEENLPLTDGDQVVAYAAVGGLFAYPFATGVAEHVSERGEADTLRIDGNRMTFVGYVPDAGNALIVRNRQTGAERISPAGQRVMPSADGRSALLYSVENEVSLYDVETGLVAPLPSALGAQEVRFTPDSRAVVFIQSDGATGRLFQVDVATLAETLLDDTISTAGMFYGVAFAPDGHVVYQSGACRTGAALVMTTLGGGPKTVLERQIPCVQPEIVDDGRSVLWAVYDETTTRVESQRLADGVRNSLGDGAVSPGPDSAHAMVAYPEPNARMMLHRWSDGQESMVRAGPSRVMALSKTHAVLSAERSGTWDLVLERFDVVHGSP